MVVLHCSQMQQCSQQEVFHAYQERQLTTLAQQQHSLRYFASSTTAAQANADRLSAGILAPSAENPAPYGTSMKVDARLPENF